MAGFSQLLAGGSPLVDRLLRRFRLRRACLRYQLNEIPLTVQIWFTAVYNSLFSLETGGGPAAPLYDGGAPPQLASSKGRYVFSFILFQLLFPRATFFSGYGTLYGEWSCKAPACWL